MANLFTAEYAEVAEKNLAKSFLTPFVFLCDLGVLGGECFFARTEKTL
jgi:hypothetical protein